MEIQVKNVNENYTNCNFCKRAEYKYNENKARIRVLPYDKVLEFGSGKSTTITVAICSDCLEELVDKADELGFIDSNKDGYTRVDWPDVQEMMEEEWFRTEAILDTRDTAPSSSYLIPVNLVIAFYKKM